MTSEILFSRRTFAGARFAERSTGDHTIYLSTYIIIHHLFLKTNFRLEKYLTLLRPEYRKPICRLRVSAHSLLIEMGRYYTPRTERICQNCMRNEIEDEEHFIIRCDKFTKAREELFELISSKIKEFTHLQDKKTLFWILNCEELDIDSYK